MFRLNCHFPRYNSTGLIECTASGSNHRLNKFKYAKIISAINNNVKKGVIFSTYSALIGESNSTQGKKFESRLKQILQWCGGDFDGCIVFDECHKAKNLCPNRTK